MNQEFQKWMNFLCSKERYHNLCISYPILLPTNHYDAINAKSLDKILLALGKISSQPNPSFIHTDLLIWESEEAQIQTKDLEKIDEFTRSKALYLPSKIILLRGPQQFSTIVSNKILKLLEDPPIELSFILLGFNYSSLLPTVRSRFLNWRLNDSDLDNAIQKIPSKQLPNWSQCKNSDEFEQWANDNNYDIEDCLDLLWRSFLQDCSQANKIERLLSFQQWFTKSKQWNNPIQERWYFLFQMAKNSL